MGGAEVIDERNEIEAAAALASVCDAAIVVGGLTPEWEAEGFDRPDLTLPGRQNDLIEAIGKANSSTIVVIQAVSYSVKYIYFTVYTSHFRDLLSVCPGLRMLSLLFMHGILVMRPEMASQISVCS